MAAEFCPKCLSPQNMNVSITTREGTDSEGKITKIETQTYHCEACHSFVRSEEIEVADDSQTAA
jgi:predicted nucleic-acid-binding Zn-ribbon protein